MIKERRSRLKGDIVYTPTARRSANSTFLPSSDLELYFDFLVQSCLAFPSELIGWSETSNVCTYIHTYIQEDLE
jgi:hypothetical protein